MRYNVYHCCTINPITCLAGVSRTVPTKLYIVLSHMKKRAKGDSRLEAAHRIFTHSSRNQWMRLLEAYMAEEIHLKIYLSICPR